MSDAVWVALISAISGIIIALISGRSGHDSDDDVDELKHEVRNLKKQLDEKKEPRK